jgi:ribosome biogenesis protein SSF1/2
MPKRGRRRKKTRTQNATDVENLTGSLTTSEETKVPKSLIIRRGKCETVVADLVHDLRNLMMPYTALNFVEDATYRKLTLAKYAQHVCLPLGVSHILAFSQNDERLSLRVAKLPQGPTLTFRVHQFSLSKHIQKLQRRPMTIKSLLDHPPIVVTNNFGDQTAPPQVKLMRITFQNMFPAINVATVKLKECRRVVLFHLVEEEVDVEVPENTQKGNDDNSENDNADGGGSKAGKTTTTKKIQQRIEMRHYAIKATPVGVDKKIRRIVQAKIPNLSKVQDIADYIEGAAKATTSVDAASDSEPEEGNAAVVELAQNYSGKGNRSQGKSALKLVELGPRMSLELIKVEQGLGGSDTPGAVMYHAHIQKTPEEARAIKEKAEQKIRLKIQRRQEQERNVERKRTAQEEKREAKKQRKEERERAAMDQLRHGGGGGGDASGDFDNEYDDEDGIGSDDDNNENLLDDDDDVDEDDDPIDDASIEVNDDDDDDDDDE